MITFIKHKPAHLLLCVGFLALFISCEKDEAHFTFSDNLKEKYRDAISGEYDTKDTIITLCLNSGKVFSQPFDTKIRITNNGQGSITFCDVPLSSLSNVASENQKLYNLFEELGSCDISFNYDFVQGDDKERVYLILHGSTYHFVLEEHRIEMRVESDMKCVFPITNNMDAIRQTFTNTRFRFDISRIIVDKKEEKDYHLIMFADIKKSNIFKTTLL